MRSSTCSATTTRSTPAASSTARCSTPYRIALDDFDVVYEEENLNAYGAPIDFTASVTTTEGSESSRSPTIKVNSPARHRRNPGLPARQRLRAGASRCAMPTGDVVTSQPVPCLPQDANLFSVCILKVPDGLDEQVGIPRPAVSDDGAARERARSRRCIPTCSIRRSPCEVYTGDLGLDEGRAVGVYTLDTDRRSPRSPVAKRRRADASQLGLGDRVDLPNGLGSVELTEIPRFVSLEIHRDPAQGWVLVFAIAAMLGLLTSLFIPRRRVWVKVAGDRIEYAGLARGEDPTLDAAVAELAEKHGRAQREHVRAAPSASVGLIRDRHPRAVLARARVLRDGCVRARVHRVRARPRAAGGGGTGGIHPAVVVRRRVGRIDRAARAHGGRERRQAAAAAGSRASPSRSPASRGCCTSRVTCCAVSPPTACRGPTCSSSRSPRRRSSWASSSRCSSGSDSSSSVCSSSASR